MLIVILLYVGNILGIIIMMLQLYAVDQIWGSVEKHVGVKQLINVLVKVKVKTKLNFLAKLKVQVQVNVKEEVKVKKRKKTRVKVKI